MSSPGAKSPGGRRDVLQRFEKKTAKGDRFWEIEASGNNVYTRYGKVGAAGRVNVKECANPSAAERVVREKVQQKLGDGYGDVALPPATPPLAPPPPSLAEQMAGKSVDELLTALEQARSQNALEPMRAACEAILEQDAANFTAHYWRFRVLDYLVTTDATDAHVDKEERDQEREWVWENADVTTQSRERYRVCLSRIWQRLQSTDFALLDETFTLIEQALELCEGEENDERLLNELRSSVYAQIAFAKFQTGEAANVSTAFYLLYHLLCRDVTKARWDSALDNGIRDRHLGVVLDKIAAFEHWVIQRSDPPPVPDLIAAYVQGCHRPADPHQMLLLVAGQKNYYSKSHLEDTWAPGRTGRVAFLLHCGADPNRIYSYDQSAVLHHLAGVGDAKAIAFLLDHGAQIDPRDKNGETPLFWAADGRRTAAAIKVLIARGADVHAVAENERNVMYNAGYNGNAETIAALIAGGADPNFKCGSMTPIEMPARNENFAAAKALLEGGAIPTQSALKTAKGYKNHRVAKQIADALDLPPIKPEDAVAHVKALAQELGEKAATEALDGGDWGYYKRESDLDANTLPGEYWEAMWCGNLKSGIAALEPRTRASLPAESELLALAFDLYKEAWMKTVKRS